MGIARLGPIKILPGASGVAVTRSGDVVRFDMDCILTDGSTARGCAVMTAQEAMDLSKELFSSATAALRWRNK